MIIVTVNNNNSITTTTSKNLPSSSVTYLHTIPQGNQEWAALAN